MDWRPGRARAGPSMAPLSPSASKALSLSAKRLLMRSRGLEDLSGKYFSSARVFDRSVGNSFLKDVWDTSGMLQVQGK